MRKGFALISLLVALGVAAPNAGAVTFGANLNEAVDNTAGCSYFAQNSCTIFSSGFYAPGSGTITSVSVKTGNGAQGPMQPIVMRSLYQNKQGDPGHPYYACCFVEEYGPTFVPNGANSVTTIATNLSVVEDPTPPADDFTTNARGDFLALSVLDGTTVFPLKSDASSIFSPIYPAPTPQTIPAPAPNPILTGYGGQGHVMMSAELNAGGGGGGGGGAKAPQGNPLQIPTGGSLIGKTANIPLTCVLTTACDGTLTLAPAVKGAAAGLAAKPKIFGSKHFNIPAGQTKTIKVKLNKAGKKKLGKRKKLKLTATATIGSQTVSSQVTLKKKKKK